VVLGATFACALASAAEVGAPVGRAPVEVVHRVGTAAEPRDRVSVERLPWSAGGFDGADDEGPDLVCGVAVAAERGSRHVRESPV
jgi:hypothetical protein